MPHEGAFADLMWSDPAELEAWALNTRGAGWLFGHRATSEYNHNNGVELVARAH